MYNSHLLFMWLKCLLQCVYYVTAVVVIILHQDDLRVDGRGCEDYRHMEIETDVVSNTDGSARVKLVKLPVLYLIYFAVSLLGWMSSLERSISTIMFK